MGKARNFLSLCAALALAGLLVGCAGAPPKPPAPQLTLTAVSFSDLPGWSNDNSAAALATFIKSCAARDRQPDNAVIAPASLGMTAAQWRKPCAAARATPNSDAAARAFFTATFTPYLAGNNSTSEGLFTGYYEPLLHGARQRGGAYQTPLMKRPPDLVMVDLGRFRPAWHGERIAGRVASGNLVPYPSRAEIERGALNANQLALFWVNDPVDAFFLEVQGSGRVELPDHSQVRLGYDGQNGQPYVAIGKKLVERGVMTTDQVSLQSIRAWIASHPDQATALMDENPSYVFFREMPGDGPVGAEGVVLTAGRSLAVDRKFIPLGTPVYLAIDDNTSPLQRLMVAQDTGGAINGPVRGDVFWGFGADAETRAGNMRAQGHYYLLLPKEVTLPRAPALS
jgi:membrane-bound lytic murein transglycosylase A